MAITTAGDLVVPLDADLARRRFQKTGAENRHAPYDAGAAWMAAIASRSSRPFS